MSLIILLRILDVAAIIATLISAWFWFKASGRSVRRLTRHEELDFHDFNRLATALNRSQVLNARAALATAISALLVAARYVVGLLAG